MINEKTAEDIGNAVKAIRKRGWTQEQFQDFHGRVCLVGALKVAIYGGVYEALIPDITPEQRERFRQAYELVYKVANRKPEYFNDSRKTKKRTVIRVLKQAQWRASERTRV